MSHLLVGTAKNAEAAGKQLAASRCGCRISHGASLALADVWTVSAMISDVSYTVFHLTRQFTVKFPTG